MAEIQGLYGPFSFPEKLLQKIWWRREFDGASAQLTDGRAVRVLYPGKWNLLGGPDFKGARLRLGDAEEITGDVELHLHATDWSAHHHADDSAYRAVVLHVVLFPPPDGYLARAADSLPIPTLVLLPLLLHDLEEYAAGEAVEALANRSVLGAIEELAAKNPSELSALIRHHAHQRWQQKKHFGRLRLQRLGWEAACHHVALEILGYRFNRVPMLRLATRFPRSDWAGGELRLDDLLAAEKEGWSVQGVRPANHPRTRLRQYLAWNRAVPDWPSKIAAMADELSLSSRETSETTTDLRRRLQLTARRRELAHRISADQIVGTRFDNLMCDGFLPILGAEKGSDLANLWFHWFAGDQPPCVLQSLRALGLIGGQNAPACHGWAQGFLGWLIEREARAVAQVSPVTFTGA